MKLADTLIDKHICAKRCPELRMSRQNILVEKQRLAERCVAYEQTVLDLNTQLDNRDGEISYWKELYHAKKQLLDDLLESFSVREREEDGKGEISRKLWW